MEQTLILIKPDALERNLCGSIINRFEQRGLRICALKMLHLSRDLAAKHYFEHQSKPFYDSLLDFITSGPIVAMILSGQGVVALARQMMGATDASLAPAGTIRGDFSFSKDRNIVHGSDSVVAAEREINLFFTKEEIFV